MRRISRTIDQEVSKEQKLHIINNLRYADDTVLLTENENDLQNLVTMVKEKNRGIWAENECQEDQDNNSKENRR